MVIAIFEPTLRCGNRGVIDAYSVKPIDTATLAAAAVATNGRIVVAEDHHPEGGLGSAVIDALIDNGASDLRTR